jgi:hypothetical protein
MALIGINSVNPGPRKPSTLEQIAQGVEIAANVLNTGLNAYKVFGIDRKQAKLQEQKVEDDFANNMRLATPEEIGADKVTPVKGRDGLFVNQEKPDPLADIKGALLGLSVEKTKGDIKKTNKDLARSPAQEMLDSTFAKDYADFVANGGYAEIESNLKRLNAVRLALKDPKINATGAVGLIPKELRDYTNPESAQLQDEVESVVQGTLRQVLGPAYTEKEGKTVIQRSYNPRQSQEVTRAKVDKLFDKLQKAAKAKADAAAYFEKHKTLDGYPGAANLARSLDDIIAPDKDEPPGERLTPIQQELRRRGLK